MSKVTHIERREEKGLPVREPLRRLGRMPTAFEDVDRMLDRMWEGFAPRWLSPLRGEWPWARELEYRVPRVDVVDRDDAVVVHAELPGVEKKDLDVSVTENSLTLRATSGREEKEEKGEYYRSEIVRGEFMRTLTLPATVDSEHAKATFKDGILELTLPKLEAAKRRTITVE